jgi:hypothetical protein
MRSPQEVPYTHIRGRNRPALQVSRFSHDCKGLMRCTRVTQECRRRQKYSVERANQAACVFHLQAPDMQWLWFRDVSQGNCSACRIFGTTLNLLRQATCHEDGFHLRPGPRADLQRAGACSLHQPSPTPRLELLPRQPLSQY